MVRNSGNMDSLRDDKQLEYAFRAVKRYHENKVPDFLDKDSHNKKLTGGTASEGNGGNGGSHSQMSNNNKRHIINVDDTSKINYEMIKNTPGNLSSIRTENGARVNNVAQLTDTEVNLVKTKMYKNKLYEQNDEYLEAVRQKIKQMSTSAEGSTDDGTDGEVDEHALGTQHEWLSQIQESLVGQYESLINEEKKWFVLKELLLDANAEFDLYSSQDEKRTIVKLGSMSLPINSNANTLIFNRTKRPRNRNIV
ncbi:hypothetical protein HG535_0H02220 [Zygotorulaspora mrakii]|uniref:Uncharacterized protein n=1 Tax=Zygotorulaspora mrakii TaxID=42260 RepID=A0A7H9B891_ZYGMR|nr:uncharacterized protein HG535_0H02220 [Zygotorulaspora mrakii]QLG74895.1 hypothetical protein HG535_0H02220 [Zygotorulaspora mrakii]